MTSTDKEVFYLVHWYGHENQAPERLFRTLQEAEDFVDGFRESWIEKCCDRLYVTKVILGENIEYNKPVYER